MNVDLNPFAQARARSRARTEAQENPAAERALFRRVQRKLAREGKTLHRQRESSRWIYETGRYYTAENNVIVDRHLILAEWM